MTGVRSGKLHEFQYVLGPLRLHYGRLLLANDLALCQVFHTQARTQINAHTLTRGLAATCILMKALNMWTVCQTSKILRKVLPFLYLLSALYCQRLEQLPSVSQANSLRRRCLSNKYPSQSLFWNCIMKLLQPLNNFHLLCNIFQTENMNLTS